MAPEEALRRVDQLHLNRHIRNEAGGLPFELLPAGLEALRQLLHPDGDMDLKIRLPNGLMWRGRPFMMAREIVDTWKLREYLASTDLNRGEAWHSVASTGPPSSATWDPIPS